MAVLANRNTTGISALLVDRILKRMLLDSAFDYQPRPVGMAILQRAARDSLGTMIRFYETARVNRSYDFSGDEDQLNSAGYEFMNGGNLAAAVRIFWLLVREHPHSANAFDSLGEACLKAGDNAGALENYRRSLELNPGNEHARKVIGQMTGK